jgi:hypothetical protein
MKGGDDDKTMNLNQVVCILTAAMFGVFISVTLLLVLLDKVVN